MNWNLLKTLSLLILVTTYGCGGSESGGGVAPGFNLPTPTGPFPSVRFAPCPPNVGVNGLRCGVLDTYENYEQTGSDARIIQVAFGILPAAVSPAAPDPVVYFTGGPGGSALARFGATRDFQAFTNNRELILVDQRGAGFSSPFLGCGEYFGVEDAADAKSCVQSFEQQGVDLSQYRTAVIAQDFKVLREALEIDQWNVYGVSYGSKPGLLYPDLDPDGVRSVIIDSGTDNQGDMALNDATARLNFVSELSSQCAASTECAAQIPDLRNFFIDTYMSLENEPWNIYIPGESPLTSGQLLFNVIPRVARTEYPALLKSIAERNSEPLLEAVAQNAADAAEQNDNFNLRSRSYASLMGTVVLCAAIDVENYSSATPPTREPWPSLMVNHEKNGVGYVRTCASDIVTIEQDLSQRTPRILDVPALIVGGGLDSIVAVDQVRKLAESFVSPRLAIVPRGDHGVAHPTTGIDPCMKGIVSSFLESPEEALDMTCLTNDVEPFVF